MPREKLYNRRTDVRTARVFVIAYEGEQTEMLYFEALCDGLRRVRLISLPTEKGHSAPEHCLERLNHFVDKNDFDAKTTGGGELWLVIDVDHWFEANRLEKTHKVLDECGRRGYNVAISNPCIEVWLLFHFKDFDNRPLENCKAAKKQVRTYLPGYDESHLDFEKLQPHIAAATKRAKNADTAPQERQPANPASRIYRLIEALSTVCGTRWPYDDLDE